MLAFDWLLDTNRETVLSPNTEVSAVDSESRVSQSADTDETPTGDQELATEENPPEPTGAEDSKGVKICIFK